MLRFFEKKTYGGFKSQICFIGDQNAVRGDRITEARRRSEMQEMVLRGFVGNHKSI